jgi:hypothetical protein
VSFLNPLFVDVQQCENSIFHAKQKSQKKTKNTSTGEFSFNPQVDDTI